MSKVLPYLPCQVIVLIAYLLSNLMYVAAVVLGCVGSWMLNLQTPSGIFCCRLVFSTVHGEFQSTTVQVCLDYFVTSYQ